MDRASPAPEFLTFRPPYRALRALEEPTADEPCPGEMLLWRLRLPLTGESFEKARARTAGTALVVILPPAEAGPFAGELLRLIELCRPQGVLPHHLEPNPLDLQAVMRRPPDDLAGEILDYLAWRGIVLDHDTRYVIRRTLELSADIKTVSALSRSLYVSRRALGRRCLDRGIPVPSHWLHLGRTVRACIQLQNLRTSLFDVASDLGYPDGFALSNQMSRLTGIRPSVARECLGWEWIVESWLRCEAEAGGLAGEYRTLVLGERRVRGSGAPPAPATSRARRSAMRRRPVAAPEA